MKNQIFALLIAGTLAGSAAFAAEKSKSDAKEKMPEPTAEQRQKMATMHEKMAECLRSTKPVSECHEEMEKSCKDSMGDECPMMGHMHMGKGHGMMMKHHEHEEEAAPAKK